MSGQLLYPSGDLFAIDATPYTVGEPGEEASGRLLIEVSIGGLRTIAAVDTGGLYFVCHPALADDLKPYLSDPISFTDHDRKTKLGIRGDEIQGDLFFLTVELLGLDGINLPVEVLVFIPDLKPGQTWGLPSIIGWEGFLDRIRFAVDPDRSLFYFGPLGQIN